MTKPTTKPPTNNSNLHTFNQGLRKEFSVFWKKLDHYQQFSLLSLAIISLSLFLGLTAIQGKQILQSQAFNQTLSRQLYQAPLISADTIDNCKTAGCSGELCVDSNSGDINSICLWKEEYVCYHNFGKCQRQTNGQCGWTPTSELNQCLQKYQSVTDEVSQEIIAQKPFITPITCDSLCPEPMYQDLATCECKYNQAIEYTDRPPNNKLSPDSISPPPQPTYLGVPFNQPCDIFCPEGFLLDAHSCSCLNARDYPQPIKSKPNIDTSDPIRSACLQSGGRWREFTNTCVDSCDIVTDSLVACGDAMTDGCDCGLNGCWDGNSCIPNPNTYGRKPGPQEKYGFSFQFQNLFDSFRNWFRYAWK